MKEKTSNDSTTINLQAPDFGGKEEEWQKFIEKFQAFFAMKGCAEVIQINFKSKYLDTNTELRW